MTAATAGAAVTFSLLAPRSKDRLRGKLGDRARLHLLLLILLGLAQLSIAFSFCHDLSFPDLGQSSRCAASERIAHVIASGNGHVMRRPGTSCRVSSNVTVSDPWPGRRNGGRSDQGYSPVRRLAL